MYIYTSMPCSAVKMEILIKTAHAQAKSQQGQKHRAAATKGRLAGLIQGKVDVMQQHEKKKTERGQKRPKREGGCTCKK